MEKKYYVCKHCGNIVEKVKDSGVSVVCCGEKMSELVPGTVEASRGQAAGSGVGYFQHQLGVTAAHFI